MNDSKNKIRKKSSKLKAPELKIEIAEVFRPLLSEAHRIKFYYGGRGGGKSYAFADSLLLLGRQKKLFIACLREIQDSIKDSVYKLLCDRISSWGLNDYKIFENKIENMMILNLLVLGFASLFSSTLSSILNIFSLCSSDNVSIKS